MYAKIVLNYQFGRLIQTIAHDHIKFDGDSRSLSMKISLFII